MRRAVETGAVGASRITVMDCATCGEVYGVTYEYSQARRRDGRGFYCPNGHAQAYSIGETA